jgi:hypothetical protein
MDPTRSRALSTSAADSAKQHVGKIAGNDKKHLHTEGVNKVIKQRQPPGGHLAINMPGVAGVNQ